MHFLRPEQVDSGDVANHSRARVLLCRYFQHPVLGYVPLLSDSVCATAASLLDDMQGISKAVGSSTISGAMFIMFPVPA